MIKIGNTVAKLRMIGKSPQILTDTSVIVMEKDEEFVTGYSVDIDGKVEEHRYEKFESLNPENTLYLAEVNGTNRLVDAELNELLNLIDEKPITLVNNLFLEVLNPRYNSKRLIGIDGTPLGEYNAKDISKYKVSQTSIIAVTSFLWSESKVDLLSFENNEYTIKHIDVSSQLRPDSDIVVGENSIFIRSEQRKKLVELDYSGKIKLSIPYGSVKFIGTDGMILVMDRFNKVIKQVKKLYMIR